MNGYMLHPQRRPNLLGIGAAKSGTTWLASVLAAHPDIFMPPKKELNALHYDDLEERLGEYSEYFRGGEAARIRCDFSVRYLNSRNAPSAAVRHTPDAKILMVARNPVDQIQSHYWHLLRQNFHQRVPLQPPPTLFEALERFPELLLEPALYGKHFSRWLDAFPRERFLILCYENVARERDQALDTICDFLTIEPFDFTAAAASVSPTESRGGVRPRGGALARLYPTLYVTVTHRGLRWLKAALGVRRTDALVRALRLRQFGERVFFKPGYEKLGQEERARLLALLRSDLERFAKAARLDITPWLASV